MENKGVLCSCTLIWTMLLLHINAKPTHSNKQHRQTHKHAHVFIYVAHHRLDWLTHTNRFGSAHTASWPAMQTQSGVSGVNSLVHGSTFR